MNSLGPDRPDNTLPAPTTQTRRRSRTGPGQLVEAVQEALRRDRHLVVEVPDDPQWSQTWLAPVVRDALEDSGQVILVVATPGRLKQLLEQDLPSLQGSLERPFSFAALKPSDRFACPERLAHIRDLRARLESHESGTSPAADRATGSPRGHRRNRTSLAQSLAELPAISFPTKVELDQISALDSWLVSGGTGLLADYPEAMTDRARSWASVDEGHCLGESCPFEDRCPARRAASEAQHATVMVCDYPAMFAKILGGHRLETGSSDLLSKVVVLLEAHAISGLAREHLTALIALDSVRELLVHLVDVGASREAVRLWQVASFYFDRLGAYFQSDQYKVRLEETHSVPARDLMRQLEDAGTLLREASLARPERTGRLLQVAARAFNLSGHLEAAMSLTDFDRMVTLDLDQNGKALLREVPVQIDCVLTPLFDARVVMMVSDTLAVGGSLDSVRVELGVPETAQGMVVAVPRSEVPRILLVVPESLPEPNERIWPAAAAARFIEVVRLAEGPTIGCFSSEQVGTHVLDYARHLGLRIPNPDETDPLLLQFIVPSPSHPADKEESTLPGSTIRKCQCISVVLDRLPFPPTDDPLLDLMRERDPRWFARFALPQAVQTFRQVTRHLLRSGARRGVLVVFDKRILSRPYGRLFTDCLPGVTISRSMQDIAPFLLGKEAHS